MSGEEDLAKDLGPLAALTIGVGTMIGAGIFVLPGDAILRSGSFAAVAFLLGGVIAMFTALSASELGTAMASAGTFRGSSVSAVPTGSALSRSMQ